MEEQTNDVDLSQTEDINSTLMEVLKDLNPVSLPSPLKEGQITIQHLSNEIVTTLTKGLILNPDYIELLSQIAVQTADDFYRELSEVRELLNKNMPKEDRCDLAKKLITSFTNTMNNALPRTIKLSAEVKEGETLFQEPQFYDFEKKKQKISEEDYLQFGEFRRGRFLVIDRFGQFFNQAVGLNTHDDAIKTSMPLSQIYAIAHELGHTIEDYFESRAEVGMRIPVYVQDVINHSKLMFNADRSYNAYKASPTEQYADIFARFATIHLINKFNEDVFNDENIKTQIARFLTDSIAITKSTIKRTSPSPESKGAIQLVQAIRLCQI